MLKSNLFIEGQYSQRTMDTTGTGSHDIVAGFDVFNTSGQLCAVTNGLVKVVGGRCLECQPLQ